HPVTVLACSRKAVVGRLEGNRTVLVVGQEVAVVLAIDFLRNDRDAIGVRHDNNTRPGRGIVRASASSDPYVVRLGEVVAIGVPAATTAEAVSHPARVIGIGRRAAHESAEAEYEEGEQVALLHALRPYMTTGSARTSAARQRRLWPDFKPATTPCQRLGRGVR